jgi:hypothetical protein
MTADRAPTLLPASITIPGFLGGAGAIAIADVGSPPNRHYIVALKSGNGAAFFEIKDYMLDDPDLQLGDPIEIETKWVVGQDTENVTVGNNTFAMPKDIRHGPDNINLLRDSNDNLYILTLGGDGVGSGPDVVSDRILHDWADLWKVDLAGKTLELVHSERIYTSSPQDTINFTDVHFRYGAGSFVQNEDMMMLYGCERNMDQGIAVHSKDHPEKDRGPYWLTINEFVPGSPKAEA